MQARTRWLTIVTTAMLGICLTGHADTPRQPAAVGAADPATASACFPACRDGYVCAPSGTCVSTCNPICSDDEQCSGGACIAKAAVPTPGLVVAPPGHAREADSGARPTIAVRTTGIIQNWRFHAMGQGFSVAHSGVSVAAEVALERLHLIAVPRLAIVFGNGNSQTEIGVDLGIRFAKRLERDRVGIDAVFTPMLFPGVAGYGQGFYYGGRGDLFYELGRYHLLAGVGYGHIATFDPDVSVLWYELGFSTRL
jgi:hypothetical protein